MRLLPLSICCLELLRVTNLITFLGIEGIGPKRAQALAREYKTLDNLLEALPIKGRAKYIQNLNAGHEKLIRNEKLINLKKYCLEAITAGKQGEEPVEQLKNL